jgi:hypothetical protein
MGYNHYPQIAQIFSYLLWQYNRSNDFSRLVFALAAPGLSPPI